MTRLENVRHAWKTGLAKPRYGTDNPANVYSEEQIHQVCQMLEVGRLNNKEIAELVGVNVTLIRDIKFRGKWKQISDLYDIPRVSAGYKNLRKDILYLMECGLSNKEVMIELQLPEKCRRHVEYVRGIYKHSLNDYPRNGSTPIS